MSGDKVTQARHDLTLAIATWVRGGVDNVDAARRVDEARQALEDALTAPGEQPEIPSGWVLVPRVATVEMLEAGSINRKGPKPFQTYTASEVAEIYDDMIAVAPKAPVPTEQLVVDTLEGWLDVADPGWRQVVRPNLTGVEATEYAVKDIAEERKLLAAEVVQLRATKPDASGPAAVHYTPDGYLQEATARLLQAVRSADQGFTVTITKADACAIGNALAAAAEKTAHPSHKGISP